MSDNLENLKEMFEAVLTMSRDLEQAYNNLKLKFNNLEIKLENNRKYLENILKSINTGVCSVDLDGSITTFNNEACKIFEISEDDANGLDFRDIFTIADFKKDVIDIIENFRNQNVFDINIHGKNKKLNTSVSPIMDNDKIIGATIIFSDITRIEELKEENRKKEKLAIIGQMAASIAHDIKNPLASIELLVPLLSKEGRGRDEILSNIMISIKRINNIINNTLLFTKTIISRPEIFYTDDFAKDVDSEIYAHLISSSVKFNKNIEKIKLATDKNLLKSAVVNLIINAIDAARDTVEFNIFSDNKSVVFEINDDGAGINDDDIKHIFEPFYTNKKNGTGLGLSIVKKAVDILSAQLSYSSSSKGTRFRITL